MTSKINTVGIAIEHDYLEDAALDFITNKDMLGAIHIAKENKTKVLVIAGRPYETYEGAFSTFINAQPLVSVAMNMANKRMAELGSEQTYWVMLGSTSFKELIRSELGFYAQATGDTITEVA